MILSGPKYRIGMPFYVLNLCRATFNRTNVWLNLEQNWNDFFWLTGETPDTLNNLAQELQDQFEPFFWRPRHGSLDFHNQVNLASYKK